MPRSLMRRSRSFVGWFTQWNERLATQLVDGPSSTSLSTSVLVKFARPPMAAPNPLRNTVIAPTLTRILRSFLYLFGGESRLDLSHLWDHCVCSCGLMNAAQV